MTLRLKQGERRDGLGLSNFPRKLSQLVWRNITGYTEAQVGGTNLWLQANLLAIKGFIMYIMRHKMYLNMQQNNWNNLIQICYILEK